MKTMARQVESISPRQEAPKHGVLVMLQLALLLALTLVVLRGEWRSLSEQVVHESEAAHALAVPLLIAVLAWRRWNLLRAALGSGSLWGLLLIVCGLLMYFASSWPFNYGYPRQLAIVPLAAGCILSVAGWRVLKLCVPMLLLLVLAIPLGMRHFATLAIRPETLTLAVAESILNMLPNVMVSLDGPDLHYTYQESSGVIALGDPFRGASLLLASATIAVFVTFISIRPLWQAMTAAILAGPLILFVNLLRVLLHGVITIYADATPIDATPRVASYVFALSLVYGMFVLLFIVLNKIVVTPQGAEAV